MHVVVSLKGVGTKLLLSTIVGAVVRMIRGISDKVSATPPSPPPSEDLVGKGCPGYSNRCFARFYAHLCQVMSRPD